MVKRQDEAASFISKNNVMTSQGPGGGGGAEVSTLRRREREREALPGFCQSLSTSMENEKKRISVRPQVCLFWRHNSEVTVKNIQDAIGCFFVAV